MKVLVVDDDKSIAQLLAEVLQHRGHDVVLCHDGESAIAAYSTAEFPLVLLDWELPGISGLDVCQKIRAQPYGDMSVILMITGRSEPSALRMALDAGASDYFPKPIDVDLLTVRLAVAERQATTQMDRKQGRQQLEEALLSAVQARDDIHSIFNQLRLGSAMTDEQGQVMFINHVAHNLFEIGPETAQGKPWEEVFAFKPADLDKVREMVVRSPETRHKLTLQLRVKSGRKYWVEVEVQNDPHYPERRIFAFYDMSEVYDLRRQLDEKSQFHDLVGRSKPMMRIYQQIHEMSDVDITVHIEGETGTGKELVAKAIHYSSHRKEQPFVAVNCAGLSDSLLASQLFGHKKGAFTGAIGEHKGLFEEADGGTLFLDEIGEIPVNVQTSLLRALQEREVTRVGENRPRKVDVRLLTATNRDLAEEVSKGTFRADLMYRIRVARVKSPPLRERREDIPLLVSNFLSKFRAVTGKQVEQMNSEALKVLLNHLWPGNVRELGNVVEVAAVCCKGSIIEMQDLPAEMLHIGEVAAPAVREERQSAPATVDIVSVAASTREVEHQRILDALQSSNGRRVEAARLLGMSRATFYRRLERYGIGLD